MPAASAAVPMDALNPFKSLQAMRFKVMYVHLTNVYDNLPFDELVRRDGRHYIVETRGYIPAADVEQLPRRVRCRGRGICRSRGAHAARWTVGGRAG